jgi:hypothetical protein
MFGLLMLGSPENQEHILNALDGTGAGTSRRAKLDRLVGQAHDFVAFYAALSSNPIESNRLDGGHEENRREPDMERGRGRGSEVAKDVVTFLERLRDGVVK